MSHSVKQSVSQQNIAAMIGESRKLDSPIVDTRYQQAKFYIMFGADISNEAGYPAGYGVVMCYHSDDYDALLQQRLPRYAYRAEFNGSRVCELPENHKRYVRWRVFRRTPNNIMVVLDTIAAPQSPVGFGLDSEW